MRFLIYYSSTYRAKENNLPRVGTPVEINTIEDLYKLAESMGNERIVFSPKDYPYNGPYWIQYYDIQDADQREDDYIIETLPEDWKSLRWIEVYNGYRE